MIVGHYATALVPYSLSNKRAPLWLLLLCSNLADFLWIALGLLGVEAPQPSSMWQATFKNIVVEMTYSHDGLPTLLLATIVTGLVFLGSRSKFLSLWCGVLVLWHWLADLLSGFGHHWLGPDSAPVGFNLYNHFPQAAILIEAAFGAILALWYIRHEAQCARTLPKRSKILLLAVFVGGALALLPTATIPLGKFFGL